MMLLRTETVVRWPLLGEALFYIAILGLARYLWT
jgi:hypothetical protein